VSLGLTLATSSESVVAADLTRKKPLGVERISIFTSGLGVAAGVGVGSSLFTSLISLTIKVNL